MFVKGKRRSNPPVKRSGSKGFPEGLNTLAHPSTLKDSELSELINGIYSQYGTISKRQGSKVIGQTADNDATQINTLKASYNIDGVSRLIRISDNGKPEYFNYTTELWSKLTDTAPDGYSGSTPTFTSGTPTFNTDSTTWIVQIGSRLYFANEDDNLVWLDEDGWHIYTSLADPTVKPTVTKGGSGTGSTRTFISMSGITKLVVL